MESNAIIASAAVFARKTDEVSKVADHISDISGELERGAYLSLVHEWRAAYAGKTALIREAKAQRREDPGRAQSLREALRVEARRLMTVRAALKEIARRHVAAARYATATE